MRLNSAAMLFCSIAVFVWPFICFSIWSLMTSLPSANAIHSNGLDAVICAFAQCGIMQTAKMTRLMIRDFIYSLFSFVILDPFPDKRYHIEVVSDAYQIKPGCIPVHREDAYRL